jgi:hypothetical protein
MSTMQRVVDGKHEDIEYNVYLDDLPAALEVVMDLYRYLQTQIPAVADALRNWRENGEHVEQAVGELFAVVDHFVTTERDTIRQAYAEKLTEEEWAELEAEHGEDAFCPDIPMTPEEIEKFVAPAYAEALRIVE